MADITGAVPIRINGKYAITVTNFQRDKNTGTKVHTGAFGNFGTSQAPEGQISGSFKVSIPKTGFEFIWANEFGGSGGSIVAEFPNKLGFTSVKLSGDSLTVDQAQGNTEQTIRWTAEHEINL
jgi:hypothetical protein